MSELVVQGDTAPDITAVLRYISNKQPLDLSTADAVFFQMRKPNDRRYTVNAEADIIGDPEDGQVSYSWGANDLAWEGEFQVQWEVHFADGKQQTTRDPVTLTVRRQ